jgi:dihydroorotase
MRVVLRGAAWHFHVKNNLKKVVDEIHKPCECSVVMKNQPYKFNSLENARTFAARCEKAMGILMGDDMKYWVVTLADFERGIRAGYEPTK